MSDKICSLLTPNKPCIKEECNFWSEEHNMCLFVLNLDPENKWRTQGVDYFFGEP